VVANEGFQLEDALWDHDNPAARCRGTLRDLNRPKTARLDVVVVIVGCLIFVLLLFLPPILNDGDTLWQIRAGEWILDHQAIPATDPFSFTAGDRRWFAHEWFAETLMALAYRAGGLKGVMVLAAAATGLTAGVLLHHLRRFLPGVYACTGLVVALSCAASSMLARPHLIAWPCLVLWCGGLVTARANRTAPAWELLLVMLVWVNLHGSFMFGLLLPIAFMIEALLDRGGGRSVFSDWSRFIGAAWLVALVNPDRLAGVLFPFHLVGMQSLAWIGEWQPSDFSKLQPLELVILGSLALGLSGRLRLPAIRLVMFLGLVHLALIHARNQQLLGIVGALILAEPIGECLFRGREEAPREVWGGLSAGALLIALAALIVRVALPLGPERTGTTFSAALQAAPLSLRAQPVLNEYGLGGQLIFNGVRPFIDSRADLYGDEFLARYLRLAVADRAELERTLFQYRITWTIFPAGHPIVSVMDERAGWRRLVDEGGIVIHARDDCLPR
jgi:hypothetical protein